MQEQTLEPYSAQWIYVNFRLQLILAKPNIKILKIRKHTSSFHEKFQSYLKIDGTIQATDMDLPSVQSIKSSLKREIVIKTGKVGLQGSRRNSQGQVYRMLLLKVAVSQIMPTFKESYLSVDDYLGQYPQYDSIYLSPRSPEVALFNHEYMVRDPSQYQWEYDVEFSLQQFQEWRPQDHICQNCHISPAKFYCIQDKEIYCWPCFGQLHRSDRKSKHTKQPLSPYNCPPKCQKSLHNNEELTHYCFTCKQLKCIHCLQDWQHNPSNPEAHKTMQNRQLAILLKQKEKQLVSQLKIKITALLREAQSKIQTTSSHYDIQIKELVRSFEQRAEAIKQKAVLYLNQVTGLHSELKKKYDQVLWLQNFSLELQQRCNCELGMQAKEGLNQYLTRSFSSQYFQKMDKRFRELKDFI